MSKDYSNQNLQKALFKNDDLANARFADSDLRGADFSGANLTGADFTHVKTGITPFNTVLIFIVALIVSAVSGFIAMLAGGTVQRMLASADPNVRAAGIATIVVIVLFIAYGYWKGGDNAFRHLLLPAVGLALLVGVAGYVTGVGTGMGMLYLVLAIFLVGLMFIVGTVARAAAGTLSSTILFILVALTGGIFGKSVGGGIGTVIMALACALISKRALSGARGFDGLRRIAFSITSKFGTSFRNTRLANADFSRSKLRNADFSHTDVSRVHWGDSKKQNCIINKEPANGGRKENR